MVGLALVIVVAMPATPAFADLVTIREPARNAVLDSASVTVRGSAEVPPETLGVRLTTLESVIVTIGDKTVTAENCTGKTSCDYQATFTLPLNGPYTADVVAKPKGLLAGDTSKASQDFAVSAPPARPVLAALKVTDTRNVELSWSRNTEPDMLYYAVFRKDPGGSKSEPVGGKVAQPASGSRVTFVDTTASGAAGGEYSYQVVAVRKGASGREAASPPSAARTATLAVTSSTSSTAVPAPGTPTVGPTTTVKPGAAAGIDLSGFLSSRSQPVTLPAITVPEAPDTGFSGNLPFGARPPGEELEEGEADAVPPRDSGGVRGSSAISVDARRPLVPVAGGMVLLLLAMHMRVLGRRVKEAGGDAGLDLTPHTPVPAALPATRPPHSAHVQPRGARTLYDIEADNTADVDAEREEDWAAAQAPEPPLAPPAPRKPVPVMVRKRTPTQVPVAAAARPEPPLEPEPTPMLVASRPPDSRPKPVPGPARKAKPRPTPVSIAAPEREPAPEPVPVAAREPRPQPVPVPARTPEPEHEPEPVAEMATQPVPVAYVEPEPDPAPVVGVQPEPQPEPVDLWGPPEPENLPEPEPEPPVVVPDEIEIVEMVSSTRRRLARAGSR